MAIPGLGQALGVIGQGIQQKAQLDWQEQRQANLERIRAQERGEDRAIREKEFSANKKLQEDQMTATTDYHNKSLENQRLNNEADTKSRNAQLSIAQESLNLQKDNSEYSRVADAYTGALAGVASLSARKAEVEKMQLKINADGQPIEDAKTFQDRKTALLSDIGSQLNAERARAREQVEKINTQFPQYKRYFAPESPQKASSGTPSLLQRATSSTKYDPNAKLF